MWRWMSTRMEIPNKVKKAARWCLDNITVEPVLLLYTMAMFTTLLTTQALYYKKSCLILFNSTVCSSLDDATHTDELDAVQKETAHWTIYTSICSLVPAIFAAMFMGSWFDKIGCKFTMLLPPIGMLIQTAVLIICSLPGYMSTSPGYILFGSIAGAVCGGFVMCISSVYSYISYISTPGNRVVRIAIAESMFYCGIAAGAGVSGIMLQTTSFTTVFLYVAIILVLLEVYIIFWINELNSGERKSPGQTGWFRYLFDIGHVKQTIYCIFKERPKSQRKLLWLMGAAFSVYLVNGVGAFELSYLFLRHDPVHWPKESAQTLFGIFSACSQISSALGMLVILPLLKRYTKFSDMAICLLGLGSRIIGLVFFGLCQNTWMVFLFASLQLLSGIPITSLRAIISKLVEPGEIGKLFANISTMESASILCGSVIYNELYPETLHFFPGFSFILAAVLLIIPFIIVCIARSTMTTQMSLEEKTVYTDDVNTNINQDTL